MPDTEIQIVKTPMPTVPDPPRCGRMIRSGFFPALAAAVVLLLLILPATASVPSDITITYNPDLHRLFVTVTHPTENPETHYIRGVRVKINGAVISDPDYRSQPGRNSFTYTYDVRANPGDSVWLVATCVQGQSLAAHIDIQRPEHEAAPVKTAPPVATTPPPEATTLPASAGTTYAGSGLLPVFGALAVLLVMRR